MRLRRTRLSYRYGSAPPTIAGSTNDRRMSETVLPMAICCVRAGSRGSSALFEPRERAPLGPRHHATGEPWFLGHHTLGVPRIVGHVGGDVQQATHLKRIGERRHHLWPHQPTMPLLVLQPRVGEPDAHLGERCGGQPTEEVDGVALDESDVLPTMLLHRLQHLRHTRRVHLHPDDALVRPKGSHGDEPLSTAEADVEHHVVRSLIRRGEHIIEVEHRALLVERPFRRLQLILGGAQG